MVAWAEAELGSGLPPVTGWHIPCENATPSPTLLCRVEEREVSEDELLAEVQAADEADAADAVDAAEATAPADAAEAAAPAAAATEAAAPAAASAKADGQWWHVGIGCSRCIHRLIIPHDPHRPPPHLM